ncbi:MAG: aminopeptidase P N-terminal domain-containing protein [Burkholderiales bacterium]|nr:aminopeptidase P N-terminal domain-containing protein [Burkholderiales bacterium]
MTFYRERREKLAQQMGAGVAVIPTAAERLRNRDSHYPFRHDSYFYYLSGFPEPEAVLVMVVTDTVKTILFCREKNMEREIWDGFRYGPDGARDAFGFDEAYPIDQLDAMLPKLLADQPSLFFDLGADPSWDTRVVGWLNSVRAEARNGVTAPGGIRDVRSLLDEMRLFKDAHELDIMRRAAQVSGGAHRRAMQAARPGRWEYEIEAELLHEFRRHGAQAPAYTSIVAGGANACVLHYVSNNDQLKAGELLLIDAGCELDGYAADITRVFPVSGQFSPVQKDLYELVLAAQTAAMSKVKPGCHWNEPHEAALRVLAQGMIDFELCAGSVDGVIESGDYKRFYMHKTGHWLGMDVHDAGEYKRGGDWRVLQADMVLTVEPGFYVRPSDQVPERFWNIGIRIEDDVRVTEGACEVMTQAAPKSVAEIEACMKNRI